MISTPGQQFTLKASEGTRLFNFIQQIIPETKAILKADSLRKFLDEIYPDHKSNPVKFLHQIDKQGKQMNQAYFGQCISYALCNQHILFNQQDLIKFHLNLKQILVGKYFKSFTRLQKWDQMQGDNTEEAIKTILTRIQVLANHFNTNVYFDSISIKNNIQNIGIFLSINTLAPSLSNKAIQFYKIILRGNLIGSLLQSFLSNSLSDFSGQMRCLAYLSGSLKYPQIHAILSKTQLFNIQTWKHLMNCYRLKGLIRLFSSVIAANFSKYIPQFCSFIWKSQYLGVICSNIAVMQDIQGLQFSLQFIKNMIKSYPYQQQNLQSNNKFNLVTMFDFTIEQLTKTISSESRMQCLNSIRELIKFFILDKQRLQKLKIINLIFSSNSIQLKLEAVHLLQTAMRFNSVDIVNLIISDNTFISYLKQCLNRTEKYPFYQGLYITYLLSFSNHIKYFFDKELIQPILKLGFKQSGFQSSIISQILLNLVSNGLDSQWRLAYMHEKFIMATLGCLLDSTIIRDPVISLYSPVNNQNLIYFNKKTFVNVFKCLYLLTQSDSIASMSAGSDKILLFVKNYSMNFIRDIHGALQNFFNGMNQNIIIPTLRQEISVQVGGKNWITMKLFKLIHLFFENVVNQIGQKQKQILKETIYVRRLYYEKLYSFASLTELYAEGVPIQIKLLMKFKQFQKKIIINCVQWSSIKQYILEWLSQVTNMKVADFIAFDSQNQTRKQVKHEIQFKQFLNASLKNYNQSKFYVGIYIQNITERRQSIDRLQVSGNSYQFRSNNINRFATTSIRQEGDLNRSQRARTPNISRHLTTSYRIPNDYRNRSPIPNVTNALKRCANCSTTTNNAQLCNNCLYKSNR